MLRRFGVSNRMRSTRRSLSVFTFQRSSPPHSFFACEAELARAAKAPSAAAARIKASRAASFRTKRA
jgi:hypothetical protein